MTAATSEGVQSLRPALSLRMLGCRCSHLCDNLHVVENGISHFDQLNVLIP